MPKRLAVAVILAAVLPMYGQEQSFHPNNNQHETSDAASPLSNHAFCVIKQDAISVECQWAEAKPQGYFERLFSSENAPNIALFLVGLAGVILAYEQY